MRTSFIVVAAISIAAVLTGCGAGHPNLKSISVSPNTANSALNQNVVFTANGIFTNNSSRNLTVADGLSWKTSNNGIATINGNTGSATCVAPGSVTVTATAPVNLQLTVNNGVSNTSTNVSGNATLNCT
jgi:methionine-rich copper-binding protein CopC